MGWGIFENFCAKSNLTVCKLQKKIAEHLEQDVLVATPISGSGAYDFQSAPNC